MDFGEGDRGYLFGCGGPGCDFACGGCDFFFGCGGGDGSNVFNGSIYTPARVGIDPNPPVGDPNASGNPFGGETFGNNAPPDPCPFWDSECQVSDGDIYLR
jgi:hypothetical protein